MLRRIGRILHIIILLVHIAVVALWVDSHWTFRRYAESSPGKGFAVMSADGLLWLNIQLDGEPVLQPQHIGPATGPMRMYEPEGAATLVGLDPLVFRPGDRPTWAFGFVSAPPWGVDVLRMHTASYATRVDFRRAAADNRVFRVHFPYWFAALITGAIVWPWRGTRFMRWIRTRRRYAEGLCPKCGYDIRANPARCSECGYEPNAIIGAPLGT